MDPSVPSIVTFSDLVELYKKQTLWKLSNERILKNKYKQNVCGEPWHVSNLLKDLMLLISGDNYTGQILLFL